jgi:hypothetical protein
MLGLTPKRPAGFPHQADAQGLHWSEPRDLDAASAEGTPAEGGLLVLVHGGAFRRECVVWSEAVSDLRSRLVQLATQPSSRPESLQPWFGWGALRFCVAIVADAEARSRALEGVETWRAASAQPVCHELLGHRRVDS